MLRNLKNLQTLFISTVLLKTVLSPRILAEIHRIKAEENEKVKKTMDKPENMQNDNTKMYAVAKKNKYLKPPQILFIRGKDGLTTDPTEQSKIVVEYFKRLFMINNI